MSGSAEDLVQDVIVWFAEPLKSLLRRALTLLLTSQFVKSRYFPDQFWQVVLGSGMGLPHSGGVADLALLTRMEGWAIRQANVYDISIYLLFQR